MTAPLPAEEKDARAVARVWAKHEAATPGLTLRTVVDEAQYHRPEQPTEVLARNLLEALAGEAQVTVRRPYSPFWNRVQELVSAS